VAIPAILLKWLKRVPFVYDINDMWPETVEDSGMSKNKMVLSFINKWCNFNYKQANKITVLSPGFKKNLTSKGVPKNKITFVNNWNRDIVYDTPLKKELKEKIFPEEKLNILYAGTLGPMQSLQTVLSTAEMLLPNDNINFVFIGAGNDEDKLKEMAHQKKLSNVTFLPRVSKDKISNYINSADVLLVHLKNTSLFEITIPSKIFSCMLHAKPILLGLKGDGADIITNSKCGILFEPENDTSLFNAIKQMERMSTFEREKMGQNGKAYYLDHYSIEKATDKMEKVFEESIK
jgi:glycosyltransferase involved in cell wall biosynthesis